MDSICLDEVMCNNQVILFDSGYESPERRVYTPGCLEGKHHVDIFFNLTDIIHLPAIIEKITSFLNVNDIYNMTKVSKKWQQVINTSINSTEKIRRYNNCIIADTENIQPLTHQTTVYTINNWKPRTLLSSLNREVNTVRVKPKKVPINASDSLFQAYFKEGSNLKEGERLYKCSTCSFPSRTDPNNGNIAMCTQENCRYRFCTKCLCQEHGKEPCRLCSPSVISRKKPTKLSIKRDLKRLCM